MLKSNKYSKLIYIILFYSLIGFNSTNSLAQTQNVALISGMLFESESKEPIQTSICFIDELGNTIKAQSEINGQFQCILKLGQDYQIATTGYLLIDNDMVIHLKNKKEYTEIKQNIELKKFSLNSVIFAINAFSPNSNVITSEGLQQLLKLKNFLLVNDKVKVNIYVSSADTYLKKIKKTKKNSSTINPSLDSFLEKRLNNIRDVLTSIKVKEFSYNLEKDYSEPKAKSNTKTSKSKKSSKSMGSSNKIVTLKAEIHHISRL